MEKKKLFSKNARRFLAARKYFIIEVCQCTYKYTLHEQLFVTGATSTTLVKTSTTAARVRTPHV